MIPGRSEHSAAHEEVLARARARAKSAWSASMHHDDLTERAASEERLMAAWPGPRVRPARAFVLGAAAAACVAALAFAFATVRSRGTSVVATPTTTVTVPTATMAIASVGSSVVVPAATEAGRRIVLTGACPDCRVAGAAVEPGVAIGTGDALSVPRGARVTVGFALHGALVDPAVGVDLDGPAVASAPDDKTIWLASGSARFRGLHAVVLTVPGGRVVADGATFTVRIDARGVARVTVEKGHVTVSSRQTDSAQTLEAGGVVELGGPEPAATVVAATAGMTAPAAATALAATAIATPAAVVDVASERRASFRLAEIEMASGDRAERERGRARLAELTVCPDVRLASDAATLLARSDTSPAGRAETWARYLATAPPASYMNRARLERAEALLDAGRSQDARAILTELRAAPLSELQKRRLERLTVRARDLD